MSDTLRDKLTAAGNTHDGHVTNGSIEEQMKILQPLIDDLDGVTRTLELIGNSDSRGIAMWQDAHPGEELTWPDRGKMIFWLLEQLK